METADIINPSNPNFSDIKPRVKPVTNPLDTEFTKIMGIKKADNVQNDSNRVVCNVFFIRYIKTELNVTPPSFALTQKLFTYSESKSDLSDGIPAEKSKPHNMPVQKHRSRKKYLYEFLLI